MIAPVFQRTVVSVAALFGSKTNSCLVPKLTAIRASDERNQNQPESGLRAFYRACHQYTCFLVLGAGCMSSLACNWHWLHASLCLAPVACSPTLSTNCMFSRSWRRLHVFSCLAIIACFPAFFTDCMSFRAWHRLHVFPCLALIV